MRELSVEEIKTVQYEILKETARFCDANGLQYFLSGGTLLGAARHKGFIPWDDDIDIEMPRPDYNRLLELSGGRLGEFYTVSVFENNPAHSRLFMRVMDDRTIYAHKYYRKRYRAGLGIDVFPMDGAPEDPQECKAYFHKVRRLKKAFALSQSAPFRSTDPVRALAKTFASVPARIKGRERLYQDIMKIVEEYPYERSSRVGITTGVYLEKEIHPKEDWFPAREIQFEEEFFHAPACYEQYLKQLYGNYMELPKEEDRVRKHAFSVYWK